MINIFVFSFSLEWDRPFELTFYANRPTNPPGRLCTWPVLHAGLVPGIQRWMTGLPRPLTSPRGRALEGPGSSRNTKRRAFNFRGGEGLGWFAGGRWEHPSPESHQCSGYRYVFTSTLTFCQAQHWLWECRVRDSPVLHPGGLRMSQFFSLEKTALQINCFILYWGHLPSAVQQVRSTCCIGHEWQVSSTCEVGMCWHLWCSSVADVYAVWTCY